MNKYITIGIVVWLIALSLFVAYYVSYDRDMQSLDIRQDKANIDSHELMIKVIINNSNRISNIENGVEDVLRVG